MSEMEDDVLLERATAALRRRVPDGELKGLRPLEGGVSSLTYATAIVEDRADRPAVIKVAPAGLAPVRNRDVLRQARILRGLERLSGFPVPRVLFEDPGDPPAVPPLFAMTLCRGESYEPLLDVTVRPPSRATAAERMRVAARALGRLHSVTPERLGADREPATSVDEELARWHRLFATVDEDIAPGHDLLHRRLEERIPSEVAPRLLHGDYRLANMLFDGVELSAVIDWEIWSVGDPRTDLAWLLMHLAPAHVFHARRPPADVEAGQGMPSRAELLHEYVAARAAHGATDDELAGTAQDLDWFLALCHYKVASTVSVIHKRDRRRDDPDPKIVTAARHLDDVLAAGHRALDGA